MPPTAARADRRFVVVLVGALVVLVGALMLAGAMLSVAILQWLFARV